MQAVGIGFVALIAIFGVYLFSTPSPQVEDVQISGTAGVPIVHREPFNFVRPTQTVSAPLPTEVVAPTVQVVPKLQLVPPVKVVEVVVPVPVPTPAVVVPQQDPAVSACLGKFVSDDCTFITQGATKNGTCITLPFSPMVCVAH